MYFSFYKPVQANNSFRRNTPGNTHTRKMYNNNNNNNNNNDNDNDNDNDDDDDDDDDDNNNNNNDNNNNNYLKDIIIIVRLTDFQDKFFIKSFIKNLPRGTGFGISDYFPKEVDEVRKL